MSDPFKELDEMLEACGARVTFDPRRSISLPCIVCGEEDLPRDLLVIGERTYPNGIKEPLRRPVCERCVHSTRWGESVDADERAESEDDRG